LTIYLAEIAIPAFIKRKTGKYIISLQFFSYDQMVNAEKHLACWGDFKGLTDALMSKTFEEGGVLSQSSRR
jgi:hypothetical protein